MKVVFWSNVRGRCGTMLHMTCLALIRALYFKKKVVLMDNHDHVPNIETCLSGSRTHDNMLRDGPVNYDYGIENLIGYIGKVPRESEKKLIERYAVSYVPDRLFYLPHGYLGNLDILDHHYTNNMNILFNSLENHFDTVFIDAFSVDNLSTKVFIDSADVVVVNLNQDERVLSHYFRNYSSFRYKSIYLLGNYCVGKFNSIKDIRHRFQINEDRIYAIPYCMEAAESGLMGCIAGFIAGNYKEPSEHNREFMIALQKAYNGIMKFYSESAVSSSERGFNLI